MSSLCSGLFEYFAKILDWTCLEKLHLEKFTIGLLIFDVAITLPILFNSAAFHFAYVDPVGQYGFVDIQWVSHDIYRFRRDQPWEHEIPIEWDIADRLYVNETRPVLDRICSRYDNNDSIPGDPGDYLVEVAAKDEGAEYSNTLKSMVALFTAAAVMMYFSEPLHLLILWWKKERGRIVAIYIFFRLFPPVILTSICVIASSDLMCAMNIIYHRHPVRTYFLCYTVFLWAYELFKFTILILLCIEQTLAQRRKEDGFRKRKIDPKKRKRPTKLNAINEDPSKGAITGPEEGNEKKGDSLLWISLDKPAKPKDGVDKPDVEKFISNRRKSMVTFPKVEKKSDGPSSALAISGKVEVADENDILKVVAGHGQDKKRKRKPK